MNSDDEKLLAHHLLVFRRIDLKAIDEVIARARKELAGWQVDEVSKARAHAIALLKARKFDAAMEAGQALWNAANGLHNALSPAARIGRNQLTCSAEGNKIKSITATARRHEWQQRANAKWKEPQHAGKSCSEIAKLIAEPGEKVDTIRKAIKKLA